MLYPPPPGHPRAPFGSLARAPLRSPSPVADFGIPYSVDMGFAFGNRTEGSWSEGNFYGCTPLPLLENNTVVEQPANLATINERYTESALGFIKSSLQDKAPFFLYLAFGHVYDNSDINLGPVARFLSAMQADTGRTT